MDSDIDRSRDDIQRIELKPNTKESSARRPVCGEKEEIEERTKFDRGTLNQEKHVEVTDPTSTEPVSGHESTKRCVLTPRHVEHDQTGTGKQVTVDQKEEHEIDFRVPSTVTCSCKRKQNISEFKSLYKGSKLILIEKHFVPTCSRITFTTHSAKIRRRWSANWAMWSYSSCAKLHQKYNVLTVFFIGIKELCTALADNAWFTANPEEIFTDNDWMHSLSRTTW